MSLTPYQQKMLSALREALHRGDRALLSAPAGAGKAGPKVSR